MQNSSYNRVSFLALRNVFRCRVDFTLHGRGPWIDSFASYDPVSQYPAESIGRVLRGVHEQCLSAAFVENLNAWLLDQKLSSFGRN